MLLSAVTALAVGKGTWPVPDRCLDSPFPDLGGRCQASRVVPPPLRPCVTLLPFLCHQIIENCPVTGIQVRADDFGVKRVYAVETAHGTIQTPCVVNCAGTGHKARRGKWGTGAVAAGQRVALHPVSRRVYVGPRSPPSGCHPKTTAGLWRTDWCSARGRSLRRRVGASPGPAGRRARPAGGDASRLRGDGAHRGHSGRSRAAADRFLCSGGQHCLLPPCTKQGEMGKTPQDPRSAGPPKHSCLQCKPVLPGQALHPGKCTSSSFSS